ncbi:MAG: sugar phosphate nucleotidyltransferase [Ignavibacteria bacterium]|nr:sugar phosphate nucleotidyltransferase [Ignavibacteria bacterium]
MLATLILAAGKGKRMKNPEKAKVMYTLKGKPLIAYVIDLSLEIESDRIIAIVGHQRKSVIDFITSNYKSNKISFAIQEEQLGTGHAVMQTYSQMKDFNGDVLILSGDVPLLKTSSIKKFLNFHIKNNFDASLISAKLDNPFGYGRIIRDDNNNLLDIREEKDANNEERKINEINSGIYIVKSNILFDALKKVTPDNAQKEYYLTDIFHQFAKNKNKIGAFLIDNPVEILGINTIEQLQELENLFT